MVAFWRNSRLAKKTTAAIRRTAPFRVTPRTEAQPLSQYVDDPVGFCLDVLGITPWDGQVEIMEAVRDNPRVSVAACYASGKTFTAAVLVLWWIHTRRPAMIITTAPTGRQVKTLLWREVRKLQKRAKRRLPGRLLQTQLHLADDWWAMGFASDAPNSVAGLHESSNVLFIEDEAAGMEAHVVEGFEGITASDNSRHLKIGNPICQDGPFFDSHMHPEEKERWKRISIDAEKTPNVIAGKTVVPGLVTREWVEDKRHRWLMRGILGLWETKVKGRFWVSAAEKLVTEAWVPLAQARWHEVGCLGPRKLGCDIAGGGQDETVVCLQEGRRVSVLDFWQSEDLIAQGRRIGNHAVEQNVQQIVVDRTGLGQGVWSTVVDLQKQDAIPEEIEIIGLKLNTRALDSDTFCGRQDEVLWHLRESLDPTNPEAIAINPDDLILAKELCMRTWRLENGKIRVQPKKELKESPDRADAVSCCTARHTLRKEPIGFL